jgi:hypothetical protein
MLSSSHTTITSSGTAFDGGWRRRWQQQSKLDVTDWRSLHQQHVDAWRALRSLAEKSSGATS